MPSRLRRRKRKPWGLTLVLLLVLIALTYATVRVYLRAPEQTADIPTITQPATPSSGSQDLSEEEAEVLRKHQEIYLERFGQEKYDRFIQIPLHPGEPCREITDWTE